MVMASQNNSGLSICDLSLRYCLNLAYLVVVINLVYQLLGCAITWLGIILNLSVA